MPLAYPLVHAFLQAHLSTPSLPPLPHHCPDGCRPKASGQPLQPDPFTALINSLAARIPRSSPGRAGLSEFLHPTPSSALPLHSTSFIVFLSHNESFICSCSGLELCHCPGALLLLTRVLAVGERPLAWSLVSLLGSPEPRPRSPRPSASLTHLLSLLWAAVPEEPLLHPPGPVPGGALTARCVPITRC